MVLRVCEIFKSIRSKETIQAAMVAGSEPNKQTEFEQGKMWSKQTLKNSKLRGQNPRMNYTGRETAACRRSWCQLLRIEDATWSAWRIRKEMRKHLKYEINTLHCNILVHCAFSPLVASLHLRRYITIQTSVCPSLAIIQHYMFRSNWPSGQQTVLRRPYRELFSDTAWPQGKLFFFVIPFYLQSVLVHSANCVKTCIQWHEEECSVALHCN
jgi:hypothetical protein